jgi:hypothetical protein
VAPTIPSLKTLRTTHLEFGLRIKDNTTAEVTLRLNQDTPAVDLVTTKISFTFKKDLEKIVLLILHAFLLSVTLRNGIIEITGKKHRL